MYEAISKLGELLWQLKVMIFLIIGIGLAGSIRRMFTK